MLLKLSFKVFHVALLTILLTALLAACQHPRPPRMPYSNSHGVLLSKPNAIHLNAKETLQRTAIMWKGPQTPMAKIHLRHIFPRINIKDYRLAKDVYYILPMYEYLAAQSGYIQLSNLGDEQFVLDITINSYKPNYFYARYDKTSREAWTDRDPWFNDDESHAFIEMTYHLIDQKSQSIIHEFVVSTTLGFCEFTKKPIAAPFFEERAVRYSQSSIGQALRANINQSLSELASYFDQTFFILHVEKIDRNHIVINVGNNLVKPNDQLQVLYEHTPTPQNLHSAFSPNRNERIGKILIQSVSEHHAIGYPINFSPKTLAIGDKILSQRNLGWPLFVSVAQAGECR